MSNFFVFTFLISIICFIVFLIKAKFRTKKFLLGAIIGIVVSFVLIGVTMTPEERAEAKQRAKEEQVAKEKAEADRRAEEQQAEVTNQQQVERTVYVAPDSGTKFHYSNTCRGLKRANSIVSMSISEATAQGYELCGFED